MLQPHNASSPPIVLRNNEIHLWLIDEQTVVDADVMMNYPAIISSHEHQRISNMKSAKRQQQYLISCAALRTILAYYLSGSSPAEIRFTKNRHGKPALQEASSQLQFNLSHTKGKVLIGIAKQRALGVDIEYIDTKRDIQKIADHYFHHNEWDSSLMGKASRNKNELAKQFYKLWTLKEAFIKAEGKGLNSPLDSFYFEDCESKKPKLFVTNSNAGPRINWKFEHAFITPDHSLAIAFEDSCSDKEVRIITRNCIPQLSFTQIELQSI